MSNDEYNKYYSLGYYINTCKYMIKVPLVVVGGGLILDDEGDLSVEVLDFKENSDCKVDIPGTSTYDIVHIRYGR